MRCYEDILVPRRAEASTFMWVSRKMHPQYSYKQPHNPTPQFHKYQVLKSRKIQELIEQISLDSGVNKMELERQVRSILDEIGYNRKMKVIRWLGLLLLTICSRINSGIFVNAIDLNGIKSQMGSCPVVFVPSHRSYADFILMSLMCFSEDFAIPAIAAGMDFHGMYGIGTMLRDTGAFFMRRSYNDDSLYWATFKQYVYQIVTKGDVPIEFFIEGTRSRSGKSLTPKYGLILMILKAFFLSQVSDILFVPINISYERVLEEKLFAYELIGIPKPKESTSGFFKSLSIIKEKYGKVHFHFCEPISAKSFFGDELDRSVHNFRSVHQQELTENEKNLVPPLAHEIVYQQQKHCIISTFNLMAILLDNNLTKGNDLLSFDQIVSEVSWLKDVLEGFGAYVDLKNPQKDVMDALEVHQNVVVLDKEKKLTLVWNELVLNKKKLKAHSLSEETINFSVPFVMLQIYINPVLHYFVDPAILVLVLKYHKHSMHKDELFGNFHFLRSLLSQEFVIYSQREKLDFEDSLVKSMHFNLIKLRSDGIYELGKNVKLEQVISTILDCFIYAYFIVCCVLEKTSDTVDEKTILAEVQIEVERGITDKNAFIHPYSLSLDSITNCLNSLTSQKVLNKARRSNGVFYEIRKNEVTFIRNKLEHYITSAQILLRKSKSVHLHLKNKL